MKLGVYTLEIGQGDLLLEDHLVESDDEVGVQETTVEDTQSEHTSDKLEVVQVFRVDSRVGVDLQRVVVVRRVLKQAVEGVEHFMREQEEEFSTSPNKSWLAIRLHADWPENTRLTSTDHHNPNHPRPRT